MAGHRLPLAAVTEIVARWARLASASELTFAGFCIWIYLAIVSGLFWLTEPITVASSILQTYEESIAVGRSRWAQEKNRSTIFRKWQCAASRPV
jgi:hypothetical protein